MSKGPPIQISATFIPTKVGSIPKTYIDNPTDLTDCFKTSLYASNYDLLVRELKEIVQDNNCQLYFQADTSHDYFIDETLVQNGAIYARREKRHEKEDTRKKVTWIKLVIIQSSSKFKHHVLNASEPIFY